MPALRNLLPFLALCIVAAGTLSNAAPPKYEPTAEQAKAWETNFSEGIVIGYSNFRGHWCDVTAPTYIFSYKCPDKMPAEEVFALLKASIGFLTISEDATELVLHYPHPPKHPDDTLEWHFLFDPKQHRITAMFASLKPKSPEAAEVEKKLRQYSESK